jgi:hypothetical protein
MFSLRLLPGRTLIRTGTSCGRPTRWVRPQGSSNPIVGSDRSNIADLLTPIALAYWLSGAATYNKAQGIVVICTDSFTADEFR